MVESGKDGKYWYRYMNDGQSNLSVALRALKEFAPLKSGELQLKYHIKTLQSFDASLDVISQRVKDDERAQEYRNSGNDLFLSNGNTAMVAEMYTQSIAYALPGSRELALAYGNRSAVSFKVRNYEDCLLDIERCLENDYPEEVRAKLHARSVRCLVALKKPQTEIEKALQDTREALLKMDQKASGRDLVEKTLSDKNHMAPTTSTKKKLNKLKPTVQDDSCDIRGATGISIQYSKKYGRHIVATRDFRPGETIAVIDPYANARSPDQCYRECAQCTKGTAVGIPCDHCVNVIYCSTSCRNKAWNDYHEIECPILGVMLDVEVPTSGLLGMKMMLKAVQEAGGVVELKNMLKQIDSVSSPRMRGFTGHVFDCTKYASIYTLARHAGKHGINERYNMSLTSTFTIYYLATLTEIFGQKYNTDLQVFNKNPLLIFLGDLMIRNSQIVKICGTGGVGAVGLQPNVQISPFIALCNHSCDPNVVSYPGNNMTFALKPIKAGEQLCDNYMGMHYSRVPKAERQKVLRSDYNFSCDCVACIENWPMYERLPDVTSMPGMSHTTQELLLTKVIWLQDKLLMLRENSLDVKNYLVDLLELLSEHAYPCQEVFAYQDYFLKIMRLSHDPS